MAAVLLPAALAFLMFVVGLRLTPADFRQVVEAPLALGAGLVAQVLVLPALALALGAAFALSPEMKLGLIIVAAAPGGVTSNFVAVLARADVALSTAMTLVTSLLAVASIPAILAIFAAGGESGGLPLLMAKTALPVLIVSAVPLIAGMAVKARWAGPIDRAEPILRRAGTLVFALLVAGVFYDNWPAVTAHAADVGPPVVLLNLGIIAIAFAAGSLLALRPAQTRAIAIECGLQNVAMAMFVCTTILGRPEVMVPAMIYAVVMNVTAVLIVVIARRRPATDMAFGASGRDDLRTGMSR